MPRHDFELCDEQSNKAREEERYAEARISVDLCERCAKQNRFPKLMKKFNIKSECLKEIVWDVEHPPYEDWDDYDCDNCGKHLTEGDN